MTTPDTRRRDDDTTATVDGTTVDGTVTTDGTTTVDSTTTTTTDDGTTATTDGATTEDDPETFPREYVQQLRKESAGYRERAQQTDQLAERLHTALVAATGRLQDASDLPFDQAHLDDADMLSAAIDELLERKPHLKSRRVVGDVGQGAGGVKAGDVNLAELLRARA